MKPTLRILPTHSVGRGKAYRTVMGVEVRWGAFCWHWWFQQPTKNKDKANHVAAFVRSLAKLGEVKCHEENE